MCRTGCAEVCGRLCYVSNTTSLANVQSELQAFLGMHEQEPVASDQLLDAVGVPSCACDFLCFLIDRSSICLTALARGALARVQEHRDLVPCRPIFATWPLRLVTDQELQAAVQGCQTCIGVVWHEHIYFPSVQSEDSCRHKAQLNYIRGSLVPLQAGLSDASVHLIENRREELAQMQWKA